MVRCALLFLPYLVLGQTGWPQFGGPNRDFTAPAGALPKEWPAGGPKTLWKRALGEGYSGIAVVDGLLYTMYLRGDQDVTVAADVRTGKTLWEHATSRRTVRSLDYSSGKGPHSTPLVAGGRVFVVNTVGHAYALDAKSGKEVWNIDLWKESTTELDRGYAASPIAWKDNILLPVGGEGKAMVALRQNDGWQVWQRGDSEGSYSSPLLFDFAGSKQVLTFFGRDIAGMSPDTGDHLWSHPHKTDYDLNVSPPLTGPDGIIVMSSAYSGGSRAVQLKNDGGRLTASEVWNQGRFRIHHNNGLRIGDAVYGSSGDFGPAPMTAVNVKDGRILWQDRTFGKCAMIQAGDRTLLLSEEGELALAVLSREGMKVLGKSQVAASNAWTAPAVANTTIFVRDRQSLMALTF
ncbi:MAG: PQQ-binding-like beta-propeller repeat protein [Bryobacterales bacterium]|nr:PQQ-binding-like beta-propeller repeat protein [Bryobacterales bacterium]